MSKCKFCGGNGNSICDSGALAFVGECEACNGTGKDTEMIKKSNEHFNALLEANYYEQIIDEACNGDLSFNNHFRRVLSLEDCQQSIEVSEVWKAYAEMV